MHFCLLIIRRKTYLAGITGKLQKMHRYTFNSSCKEKKRECTGGEAESRLLVSSLMTRHFCDILCSTRGARVFVFFFFSFSFTLPPLRLVATVLFLVSLPHAAREYGCVTLLTFCLLLFLLCLGFFPHRASNEKSSFPRNDFGVPSATGDAKPRTEREQRFHWGRAMPSRRLDNSFVKLNASQSMMDHKYLASRMQESFARCTAFIVSS